MHAYKATYRRSPSEKQYLRRRRMIGDVLLKKNYSSDRLCFYVDGRCCIKIPREEKFNTIFDHIFEEEKKTDTKKEHWKKLHFHMAWVDTCIESTVAILITTTDTNERFFSICVLFTLNYRAHLYPAVCWL